MKRLSTASIFLGLFLTSCVGQQAASAPTAAPVSGQQDSAPTSQAAAPAPAPVADIYANEPTPLTVAQCGQCHPAIYQQVRGEGKKHKFSCQDCHQQLHAYNPVRQNWQEIMPKCASCHDLPHGQAFSSCLDCHHNPHTPLAIPLQSIETSCGTCHTNPQGELTSFPSKHTEQGCGTCHTSHGFIPSCMECHKPHLADQPQEACLSCHPVHKPKQITFDGSDRWNPTCGTCHDGAFAAWSKTASKHGGVNCGECHTSHGFIPNCTTCHSAPHDARLLEKFPRCLDCHINPHDLPVKGQQ